MGRDRYLSLWLSIKFVMFKFARLIICRSQICINHKSNIKQISIIMEKWLCLWALPRWTLRKTIKSFKRYWNWKLMLAEGGECAGSLFLSDHLIKSNLPSRNWYSSNWNGTGLWICGTSSKMTTCPDLIWQLIVNHSLFALFATTTIIT